MSIGRQKQQQQISEIVCETSRLFSLTFILSVNFPQKIERYTCVKRTIQFEWLRKKTINVHDAAATAVARSKWTRNGKRRTRFEKCLTTSARAAKSWWWILYQSRESETAHWCWVENVLLSLPPWMLLRLSRSMTNTVRCAVNCSMCIARLGGRQRAQNTSLRESICVFEWPLSMLRINIFLALSLLQFRWNRISFGDECFIRTTTKSTASLSVCVSACVCARMRMCECVYVWARVPLCIHVTQQENVCA